MTDTDQFIRTRLLLGDNALKTLQNSFVVVVGLGAVGSFAVEALARAGIGKLRLVDGDTVSLSNINRQIFALHSTVGQSKALLAATRVRDINPACVVDPVNAFASDDNFDTLFSDKPDFVIDAIDSLTAKTAMIASLQTHGIPFISSMGAAVRTDLTQIHVSTPEKVTHCSLTAFLRQRLRRRNISLDFPCVCSCEPHDNLPNPIREEGAPETERTVMGSLVSVTGIFGLTAAHYVLMQLAKNNTP